MRLSGRLDWPSLRRGRKRVRLRLLEPLQEQRHLPEHQRQLHLPVHARLLRPQVRVQHRRLFAHQSLLEWGNLRRRTGRVQLLLRRRVSDGVFIRHSSRLSLLFPLTALLVVVLTFF